MVLLQKSLDSLRIGVVDVHFIRGRLLDVVVSEHGTEDLRASGKDRLVRGQPLFSTHDGDVG